MITVTHGQIDLRQTMYPTEAFLLTPKTPNYEFPMASTLYGYVYKGEIVINDTFYTEGQYFSYPCSLDTQVEGVDDDFSAMVICRLGYIGQNMAGWQTETKGRLSYIDGCSDSLIVYPPRKGDPSLNYLYFPPKIEQSFHTHPSIRVGMVIGGSGFSWLSKTSKQPLKPGTMFALEEHELHRFSTTNENMRIIAFHPDGDFGPTDEFHTMLNRTYIAK